MYYDFLLMNILGSISIVTIIEREREREREREKIAKSIPFLRYR